jgi:hypothetical protein
MVDTKPARPDTRQPHQIAPDYIRNSHARHLLLDAGYNLLGPYFTPAIC